MPNKIIAGIFFIFLLLATLVWVERIPDYFNCLYENDSNCLTSFILLSPMVTEATDLAESCDDPDMECATKIGYMYIEENMG